VCLRRAYSYHCLGVFGVFVLLIACVWEERIRIAVWDRVFGVFVLLIAYSFSVFVSLLGSVCLAYSACV
jgi:hypothetical protein